jgi:predicted phosphodiesterase
MRILHLSDLHLTGQFKAFDEVWNGPSAHLVPGSFDFIIVSGDLSQRSAPSEYELLQAFLERSLLPLLVKHERERIILVPGNHDVDWNANIGERLSLSHEMETNPRFVEELRAARVEPERSDLRVSIGKHGHLDVLRIDPKRYPSRFQHVQHFFDTFYRGIPPSGRFQPFMLTREDTAGHWSAHVFPEERIAFYGFNSCHRNDRYWTGAMFSAEAIEQARRHAEEHAKGCLRIAVWHHGLDSGRGRPDHLSAQDLGSLYNIGFRIGFHGHTHRSAYETFDALFGNRFCVVSTGSLGAGSEERPDAVGNQFSVAQVHPDHVDLEVYTRDGLSSTYERHRERRRFMLRGPNAPRLDQLSHAASHRRTWTVASDGITRMNVELRDLTLRSAVTLALIEPPFCNVLGDKEAETPTGRLPVEHKELPDGRHRFSVVASGPEEKLDLLRWSCHISNCLALTQVDLQSRGEPRTLAEGFNGRAYTVRFPCDELSLAISLPEDALVPGAIKATALRRQEERGEERWVEDPSAGTRAKPKGDARHVEWTIPAPLVDHRYLLTYQPQEVGQPHSADILQLLQWLLEQCRDRPALEQSLSVALTRSMDDELARVLGSQVGRASAWTGCLWHPSRHGLMTAFGVFPNRMWAVRFDWGSGVAGHALRFSRDASWVQGSASHRSLIYRPNSTVSPEGDYSWIVCIPILSSLAGPALGVVSFAGTQQGGMGEEQLREYAQHVALHPNGDLSTQFIEFRDRLFTAVNTTFWQVLRSWKALTPNRRALVEKIASDLEIPAPGEPLPSVPPPRR